MSAGNSESSFSRKIKEETVSSRRTDPGFMKAFAAGCCMSVIETEPFKVTSPIKLVAEVKAFTVKAFELSGISYELNGNRLVPDEEDAFKLWQYLAKFEPADFQNNTETVKGVIDGVFAVSGYCSDPAKEYRIEMHTSCFEAAAMLCSMLRTWQIDPSVKDRGEYTAVYFKAGDMVSDFLGHAGAVKAMLEYENIRAQKSVKSDVVRTVNCDEGNSRRQSEAAAVRDAKIRRLLASPRGKKLPPELYEAAVAQTEHPECSIAELGALMNPPIGKSGMNHRLKKLLELADTLENPVD